MIARLRPRVRERIATPSEHAAYHEAMIARSLVRDQYQATSPATRGRSEPRAPLSESPHRGVGWRLGP